MAYSLKKRIGNVFKFAVLTVFFFEIFSSVGFASIRRFPFQGQLNFVDHEFKMKIDINSQSSISADFAQSSREEFVLRLILDHIQTPYFEISTEVTTQLKRNRVDSGSFLSLTGSILSKYSLVNRKPIQELTGQIKVEDRKVYLERLSLEKATCDGVLDFSDSFKADLTTSFKDVPVGEILALFAEGEAVKSSGDVKGKLQVTGNLSQFNLVGGFQIYDGFVDRMAFDSLLVNFEGIYPIVHLANSTITEQDGLTFALNGDLNLSRIDIFADQLDTLEKSTLTTNNQKQSEWTLKRRENKSKRAVTELKYILKDEKKPNNEDELNGVLGVERKVKF